MKTLRDYRAAAEAKGFVWLRADYGKHLKLRLAARSGKPVTIVASRTPSDFRTIHNFKRELRHAAGA